MAPTLISAPTSLADAQWFFSPKELARPPSVRAENPLSLEKERYARAKVVRRLWEIKNAIKLPTLVIGTASTFVHRFYMRETIQQFPPEVTAAAACFLASKVEEKPRSLRTILGCALEAERHNGFVALDRQMRVKVDEKDRGFIKFKQAVLHCEETMLRALCFDLTVRLPYPAITKGVKRMWKGDGVTAEQVARAAWVVVNDTLPTTIVLVHRPNVIAAAAIVIACEQLVVSIPTPNKAEAREGGGMDQDAEEGEEPEEEPYWLELFDVKVEEVQDAVKMILEVYKRAVDPFVYEEAAKLVPKALAAASKIEPAPIPLPTPPPAAIAVEPTPPSAEVPLDAPPLPAPLAPPLAPSTNMAEPLSDLFRMPSLAPPNSSTYTPPPPPPAAPPPLPSAEPVAAPHPPLFAHHSAPQPQAPLPSAPLPPSPSQLYGYRAPPPPPPPPAPLPPTEPEQQLSITPVGEAAATGGESQEELIVTQEPGLIVTEAEQLVISQRDEAGSLKRPFGELGDGLVAEGEGSEEKKIKLD